MLRRLQEAEQRAKPPGEKDQRSRTESRLLYDMSEIGSEYPASEFYDIPLSDPGTMDRSNSVVYAKIRGLFLEPKRKNRFEESGLGE